MGPPYKNTLDDYRATITTGDVVRKLTSVFLYGNVAKWLMLLLHTEKGVGSNPTITTKEVWQSLADCTGLENRRLERVREFESHRFRQII